MTAAQKEAAVKQQEAFQKAAELKQMLNNLEKVDDDGRRSSLLDTLCSTDDILNLPLHPDPPGIKNGNLVVDLLKHQVRCWVLWPLYPLCDNFTRVKRCNGAFNANILFYQRKTQINQSNSGSLGETVLRYTRSFDYYFG
jgi:hypothetical protein